MTVYGKETLLFPLMLLKNELGAKCGHNKCAFMLYLIAETREIEGC